MKVGHFVGALNLTSHISVVCTRVQVWGQDNPQSLLHQITLLSSGVLRSLDAKQCQQMQARTGHSSQQQQQWQFEGIADRDLDTT